MCVCLCVCLCVCVCVCVFVYVSVCVFVYVSVCPGIGFNNVTVVYLARHLLSGQPVIIRRSNIDELTDGQMSELLVGLHCCVSLNLAVFRRKRTFSSYVKNQR